MALYAAVIAGCQSVLQDTRSTYLAFRLVIYVIALVSTILIAFRSVRVAISRDAPDRNQQTLLSWELHTATLSFGAWGLSQPGSFLYVWLSSPTLSVVVITVTAVTGLLLAAFFAPKLRSPAGDSTDPWHGAESSSMSEPVNRCTVGQGGDNTVFR